MKKVLRFVWMATRGHRLTPWRSPYLRWRIETYTGMKMEKVGFLQFWIFLWRERQELARFLKWTATMQDYAAPSLEIPDQRCVAHRTLLLDFYYMSDAKQQAEDHYYAALDLFAEGKQDASIAEYERCLELDPSHAEALHGLARAYQDLGRFDDSIAASKRLVELDPEDILGHTSLSIAYQKKGMIPEAEAAANQARILGWKKQLQDAKQANSPPNAEE